MPAAMKPEKKEVIAAAVPLLPKTKPNEISNAASISGAVFNISTSMIGAGIMSVPATLKVLGIIPGFIVILIMGFLVEITVEFLLRYTHSGESNTYGGLMAESFGKVGSVAIKLCITITNLGALIIYLIIIGDVLSGTESEGTLHLGVLQEWFGIQWWTSRACTLLFIVLFVMLPLLLLPRVESLRHASAVSILLAVVFIVITMGLAIYAMYQGKTEKLRLLPDFSNGDSVYQLFTAIPVYATALACHVTIHPVRAELRKTSNMSKAVKISLLLTVTVYFAVGFVGYLLFGDSIQADVLVNFDQHSDSPIGLLINDIIRLSYAIHLMLVFPVIHFILRANVDELIFPNKPSLETDKRRFVSLTCMQLAFIYIVAIAIPNIWYFFQFMGSTTIACISFIFPGAIVLRDVHGISTRKDRIMAVLVIIVAVVTSAIAIFTNVQSFRQQG